MLAPDGSITGLWTEETQADGCDPYTTDPGCEIRVARLTAAGWSAATTLSTADAYHQGSRLVVDADGRVTALWLQTGGGSIGASTWASRWSDGTWSPAQQISAGGLGIYYTALAVAGDGTVLAAWSDSNADDVQTATFTGGTWSAAVTVPDGGQTSTHIDALVSSPDGSFTMLVRRTASDRIGAARLDAGTWTDEGLISPSGRAAYGGTAVVAATGTVTVAWYSLISGRYVIESAVRTTGTWGAPVAVSSGVNHAQSPALAIDGDGAVTAIWSEFDGSFSALPPRYAERAGGAWATPTGLSSVPGAAVIDGLLEDETGAPVAVVASWNGSAWAGSSTRFAGGTWTTAQPLEPGTPWRAYAITDTGWGSAVALVGAGSTYDLIRYGSPPTAPRNVHAVAGDRALDVSWSASALPTTAPVTGYTATAAPGGATCTTTGATTCTIPGLTAGTSYRVTVTATSLLGTSAASSPSDPVAIAGPAAAPASPPSSDPPVVGRIAPTAAGSSAAVSIPVTAPAAGRMTVTGTTAARGAAGRTEPRRVWRCTVRATFTRAGTRVLRCDLRPRAQRLLQRGALHMAFHVVFAPADGGAPTESVVAATIPARR